VKFLRSIEIEIDDYKIIRLVKINLLTKKIILVNIFGAIHFSYLLLLSNMVPYIVQNNDRHMEDSFIANVYPFRIYRLNVGF